MFDRASLVTMVKKEGN